MAPKATSKKIIRTGSIPNNPNTESEFISSRPCIRASNNARRSAGNGNFDGAIEYKRKRRKSGLTCCAILFYRTKCVQPKKVLNADLHILP